LSEVKKVVFLVNKFVFSTYTFMPSLKVPAFKVLHFIDIGFTVNFYFLTQRSSILLHLFQLLSHVLDHLTHRLLNFCCQTNTIFSLMIIRSGNLIDYFYPTFINTLSNMPDLGFLTFHTVQTNMLWLFLFLHPYNPVCWEFLLTMLAFNCKEMELAQCLRSFHLIFFLYSSIILFLYTIFFSIFPILFQLF
jgi:hypothetical protein